MSDTPPPYSLVRYTPSSSIWARALNWVSYLDATVTVEDSQRSVAVAVEDLRPRAKYVQTTLTAVDDIRFCEKMFNNWMTELSKARSNPSEKPDERERVLKFYLELLKEDAGRCSNVANTILQRHVRFASLMAQRIDDAFENNSRYDDLETTGLAKDINEASRSLSLYVTEMINRLDSFVSVLEEVRVEVTKEPSLVERILGWLKSLFNAIARILSTFCPPISAILHHSAEPRVKLSAPVVSTIGRAAATFCTADLEPGKEFESLDNVILFLKEIVPREAQVAKKKLGRFDEALYFMGLESQMRAGGRVNLFGRDPAAVAQEWRDVAEKYRSALQSGAA